MSRAPRSRTKKKHKYNASFLNRGKWWVGWTDNFPSALTQGRTLTKARENLRDAMALMLETVNLEDLPSARTRLVHEVLEV